MPDILRPGDVISGWCSKCGHATPHVYQPEQFCKLRCVACKPEPEQKPDEKKGRVR